MKIEIKNRFNGKIIISGEYSSIKEALEKNRGANLSYANLRGADLRNADLRDTNLRNADLRYADIIDADLSCANLSYADLRDTNLRNADLSYADIIDADLNCADLNYANLRGADLSCANLSYADLRNADLRDTNLRNAELRNAELKGAKFDQKYLISLTSICAEGDLIGWKKCKDDIIVKLKIPAKSKRSNSTGRKCRAEYVKILEIFGSEEALSNYDGKTIYKIGEKIKCHNWDDNRWNECSGGIHFFITREEAERY